MDYDYQPPKIEHIQYIAVEAAGGSKDLEAIKNEVRDAYGEVVESNKENKSCGNSRSCCGVSAKPDATYSQELGYTKEEFESVPEGANMGLGCGNPQAIANLKQIESSFLILWVVVHGRS